MDFGTYQNYNPNLPNLDLYRYENIFKVYQTLDKNQDYFYNIIKNINVPGNINNDVFFTVVYQANTPFTTLSYQAYGTTYLWWLICIINNIQNPFDIANSGKTLKIIKPNYIKAVLDTITQQLQ
jgi:hypothetical protein